MKTHKKTTLHPLSFSAAFLMAAFSMISSNEKLSLSFKLLSTLSFFSGIYNLYHENRLKKAFRPLTNYLFSLWEKPSTNNSLLTIMDEDLNNKVPLSPKFK